MIQDGTFAFSGDSADRQPPVVSGESLHAPKNLDLQRIDGEDASQRMIRYNGLAHTPSVLLTSLAGTNVYDL